jgi:hypothetical protein
MSYIRLAWFIGRELGGLSALPSWLLLAFCHTKSNRPSLEALSPTNAAKEAGYVLGRVLIRIQGVKGVQACLMYLVET